MIFKYNPLSNQRGSILYSLAALTILFSFIAYVSSTLFQPQSNDTTRLNLSLTLSLLTSNITTIVTKLDSWNSLLNHSGAGTCNATLSCVKNGTSCAVLLGSTTGPETPPQPLPCLYDGNEQVFFNYNVPTNGFTDSGLPCNTYGAAVERSICPIRPQITFQVLNCTPGDCTNKPLRISVAFQTDSHLGTSLNPTPFNFSTNR